MYVQLLFGISVAFGFAAWAVVTALYIWPELQARSRIEALRPLLALHGFRFIGLSFLVPGVVSPDLPIAFARDAAYGDIVAAILALLALTQSQAFWNLMPWPGSRFSPGSALGRPIMGVRGEALQCVNRPFPGRDNGQQPARSRFNPPSRPGQRLRECGAGTMDWDQAVAVSLVHQNSVPSVL
jgi:hypothetical protein